MITKGEVLIRVEDLHKVFNNELHALNGISTEIRKGEVVVIVGPSGSGKSTFLRSLNLLEVPSQGKIYFEGYEWTPFLTTIKSGNKDIYQVIYDEQTKSFTLTLVEKSKNS